MNPLLVEVRRGNDVESLHRVHVVACDARSAASHNGGTSVASPAAPPHVVWSAGDPHLVSFVRSAIKMFQALPLVEDAGIERFGLTPQELAVCTASHGGEPFHVAAARSILQKAGVDERALACGPHPPMHAESAQVLMEKGEPPARIHNNCSGKHAGMLALAALNGWPLEGYHALDHPVQQRVLKTLMQWMGAEKADIRIAIDGCGLPTFGLPLHAVALACARFAVAAGERDPVARDTSPKTGAAARILAVMTSHPEFVAGTDRLDTDLMRVTRGRVFAKVGAEGYYCAGVPTAGVGLALKVEDGAKRASEPALLAVLHAQDLITSDELTSLDQYARPAVLNTRGERVGEIRVTIGH